MTGGVVWPSTDTRTVTPSDASGGALPAAAPCAAADLAAAAAAASVIATALDLAVAPGPSGANIAG